MQAFDSGTAGSWLSETPLNILGGINLTASRLLTPRTPGEARRFPRIEYCRMNLYHTTPTPFSLWLSPLNPADHVGIVIDRHWELVDPVIWIPPSPLPFLPSSSHAALLDQLTDPLTKQRGTWLLRSMRLGLPTFCEPVLAEAEDPRTELEVMDAVFCAHRALLLRKPGYSFFGYNCGGSASDILENASLIRPFTTNLGIGDRFRTGSIPRTNSECALRLAAWSRISRNLEKGDLPSVTDRALAIEALDAFTEDLRIPGISWDRVQDWEKAAKPSSGPGSSWMRREFNKRDFSYARSLTSRSHPRGSRGSSEPSSPSSHPSPSPR